MDTIGEDSGYPEFVEVRTLRPSEIPTIPAPGGPVLHEYRVSTVLSYYRREQAKLAVLTAELKAMGIDPQSAWTPGIADAPESEEDAS